MRNMKNSSAQGTIEYLVIIAVVVVIALVVVALVLNMSDSEQTQIISNKSQNLIGKGGISINDSVTSSSGDAIISLGNNSGENLTITSITPTNTQTEGEINYCIGKIFPGSKENCVLTDVDLVCPCSGNQTVTCSFKINYQTKDGLIKTETFNITNTCVEKIDLLTITYNAGTGGTINEEPTITQKVLPGENNLGVIAIPNEGYDFNSWSDGSTNPTRKETNITENLTINATFKEKEEPILECTPEGSRYNPTIGPPCCEGFIPIGVGYTEPPCYFIKSVRVCSNCGNGTCESWENICNCPTDC